MVHQVLNHHVHVVDVLLPLLWVLGGRGVHPDAVHRLPLGHRVGGAVLDHYLLLKGHHVNQGSSCLSLLLHGQGEVEYQKSYDSIINYIFRLDT